MIRYVLILAFFPIAVLVSCKKEKKQVSQEETQNEQKVKNISELSYQEIFYLLHDEDEYGVDYHGEVFGQDASSKAKLVKIDDSDCGDAIGLVNTDSSAVMEAAVKISFSFPGNEIKEFHRLYTVKPGETAPVGHSKLCYDGSEYTIQREVASAGFKD